MHDFYNDENVNIDIVDDNLINKFNVIELFGKDILEDIQEKISKATGLAFVTVDYKGDPITKLTSFTKFCSEVRKKTNACDCKASDAFGGIQAAVIQKNCMYFCPCGLLEIAIPIIVRGHYLGGFIGGQVRCLDAPEDISKLENVLNNSKQYKEDVYMKDLFNEIPVYEYEKFVNVAELISLIINQLGEKEAYRLVQKDQLKKELEESENSKRKLEIENDLKNIEIVNLKADLNPYSLINVMNSISNLAVIEDSPKTNELIILFSEYLKQNFCNSKLNISLIYENQNEIERIFSIIRDKDFRRAYYEISEIVEGIYSSINKNSKCPKEYFLELGQHLINNVELLNGTSQDINELFPIDEFSINDKKYFELWLFKVINYIFQNISIKKYKLLESVFEYIEDHIEEEIGLNEIINKCSVSQGYLSRIFKNQFNISVMEYLHMRKIYLAKTYFSFSDLSTTDVAFKLGYNESSYFGKVFKKYENITVHQYKKSLKSLK